MQVFNVQLNTFFYKNLDFLMSGFIDKGEKKIVLDYLVDRKNYFNFEKLTNAIYQIFDYEEYFEIKIKNFPYCLIPEAKDHVFFEENFVGIKLKYCKSCQYNRKCQGIKKELLDNFGEDAFKPIKYLPEEIMVEIESRCNFDCKFCYNKNSFAKNTRGSQNLASSYIKKIIDEIERVGIKAIRFTGGEPLLRSDIFELTEYAKLKNLEVRMNTNASLINEVVARRLVGAVDNILIPLEATNPKEEAQITGFKKAFFNKKRAIEFLKKYGIKVVRCGTVATRRNIKNLEKFFKLISSWELDEWELYRPISINGEREAWSSGDVKNLVEKLIKFRKISGRTFFITNGLPFCSYDKNKVNSVSAGAIPEDGHIRFAVDPRGFAKPHYYFNKKIGSPLALLDCWNSKFMKKIRNLEFVQKKCKTCSFLEKCRGGSRYLAKMINGRYDAKDPLMKIALNK